MCIFYSAQNVLFWSRIYTIYITICESNYNKNTYKELKILRFMFNSKDLFENLSRFTGVLVNENEIWSARSLFCMYFRKRILEECQFQNQNNKWHKIKIFNAFLMKEVSLINQLIPQFWLSKVHLLLWKLTIKHYLNELTILTKWKYLCIQERSVSFVKLTNEVFFKDYII